MDNEVLANEQHEQAGPPRTIQDDLQDLDHGEFRSLLDIHRVAAITAPVADEGEQHDDSDSKSPTGQNAPNVAINVLWLESAEHDYLGDSLVLPGHDSIKDPKKADLGTAAKNPLTLPNSLSLTYGQINALAGDYFATADAITKDDNFDQQVARFLQAFDTLASNQDGKNRAEATLKIMKKEIDLIKQARMHGPEAVRKAYEALGNTLEPDYEKLSQEYPGPDYETLLKNNIDHFAPNSHAAYNAGHHAALEAAKAGDLELAYARNAFADHYLEDSFASGHLRVPRLAMTANIFSNICANFMHNEDNVNGLLVFTPNDRVEWKTYGDTMLFVHADKDPNITHILAALKASVQEVYDTYADRSKPTPIKTPDQFEAWSHAPSLKSIMSQQNYAPMFQIDKATNQVWQRKGLDKNPTVLPMKWEYEPVIGTWGSRIPKWIFSDEARAYVYWGVLAYKTAPTNTIKYLIGAKLKAGLHGWLPEWLVDQILKHFGLEDPNAPPA